MIVNFTPTGMVPTKQTAPSVPLQAHEIVEQVHAAHEVGITMVHLHARNADATPSSKVEDYAPILEGIRAHCPELVICTSLSGRNVIDPVLRSEVLSLKPDLASLTLSSLNFFSQASLNAPDTIQQLAANIREAGAKPELEVFDLGMMNYLHYLQRKRLVEAPFYINILLGNIAGAQLNPSSVGALLQEAPENSHIALAGIGQTQFDSHMMALSLNLGVRIGLEDNTWFDRDRNRPATNLTLLKRLHALMELSERKLCTAKEFGEMGFYNSHRNLK